MAGTISGIQPGLGSANFNPTQGLASLLQSLNRGQGASGTQSPQENSNVSPEALEEQLIQMLEQEVALLEQQLQQAQQNNDPSANQLQQQLQQAQQELADMSGQNSNFNPSSLFNGGGGGGGGVGDAGGGGGGSVGSGGSSGGASGSGGTGAPTDPTPISATGNGSQAVQIANSQMGKLAQDVNIPDYTHAGGDTNDCADFVSACVADAGTFQKNAGDASVTTFQSDLQKQGWNAVPQSQAKPGDVAIILGGGVQHTELVANNGATQCIGSNGTSQEQVSTDNPSSWNNGVTYYAPPAKKG